MKRRRAHTQPDVPQQEGKPFFTKAGAQPDVQSKDEGFFQPKLTLGKPGDRYEQEADRMADAVANPSRSASPEATAVRKKAKLQRQAMEEKEPQAKLQRQEEEEVQTKLQRQPMEEEEEMMQPKLQRQEEEEAQTKLQRQEEEEMMQPKVQLQEEEEEAQPKLQRQEEEEAQTKVQRQEEEEEAQPKLQAQTSQTGQARAGLAQRLAKNKGQGRPLSPKVRGKMEAAFDTDFSGVRIHTDAEAVQMSEELGAQAFTHGQDVYFNEGTYNPASSDGKHLLAHELTHVVQQSKK